MAELIDDGADGMLASDITSATAAVDRVGGLDRAAIRASAVARFSRATMVDQYVGVYRAVLAAA